MVFVTGMLAGCAADTPLDVEPVALVRECPYLFVDEYLGAELVLVPSGSFVMGSPESEKGRDKDESPAHKVEIDSFYIGRYEITQPQWEKVMGKNPSKFRGLPDLPVEGVSWKDVKEFLIRLQKKTRLPYRLSTEAEWEYVCRAGSQTPFCSGSDERSLNEYAWFSINAGGETHRVGSRLPNKLGVYDMHGNVSEWVGDGRRGYLSRTENNPVGPSSSKKAIHRGGCWLYPARLCRSANRMSADKEFRSHIIGFRLAINKNSICNPRRP
ncbi:MAG: formylglycine-generating enzyme family protein [Thermodesulfobacteriota bacterium]|nr:formylglycine-generating enzyme family protein [Thermodesulfobacteriota bacterium]